MLDMILKNWTHMGPILGAGFFAGLLVLDRFSALYVKYHFSGLDAFYESIRSLVLADRTNEAIALCDRKGAKLEAQVVKAGLMRMQDPEELIQHALEVAVAEASECVSKRTSYLATLANVATLLGLFGTILGMIQSFEALGSASAAQRSALLAEGISTAMQATLFGLGVAIPCMLLYAFFAAKVNRMTGSIERAGIRTLDIIKQRYYGSSSGSSHASTRSSRAA
jgi:biopolymer transport protein ExbB